MEQRTNPIAVYLETGRTRVIASALDWPGWCRGGRDEASALQMLRDYAPRYGRVLHAAGLSFRAPSGASDLVVVERVPGNATTDYGVPAQVLPRDAEPTGPADLERWQAVLDACWQALDAAALLAEGKALRKGPRGGGRDLGKIVAHVKDSAAGYLSSLGGKADPNPPEAFRAAILATMAASARGEVPARGPRGGSRWPPRYFVRRLAWHILDHVWEIEDRMMEI